MRARCHWPGEAGEGMFFLRGRGWLCHPRPLGSILPSPQILSADDEPSRGEGDGWGRDSRNRDVACSSVLSWSYRSACTTTPTIAPPTISQLEFTLKRSKRNRAAAPVRIVAGSVRAARSRSSVTDAISPSEAATTPSRNDRVQGEAWRRGMSGPARATKANDGRNIATVARSAPGGAARREPMKGAQGKKG